MEENRWTELVGYFVGWFLEHENSNDRLHEILCEEIGMTQEELHDCCVESLDEYFGQGTECQSPITEGMSM